MAILNSNRILACSTRKWHQRNEWLDQEWNRQLLAPTLLSEGMELSPLLAQQAPLLTQQSRLLAQQSRLLAQQVPLLTQQAPLLTQQSRLVAQKEQEVFQEFTIIIRNN